ncbi:hypothetical protein CQW23_25374 [Capsicum baccatum]|uniref:F-box domain-containing protein n=1 Tax=Capsicum baccatum TaxID=33114 RepID=A0A2G2VKR3_CAPBA|nr:hypothetical protein CQW23_25374 [Capsicum baccatum]
MDANNNKPKSSNLFNGDCKRTRISHVTIMDLPTVIMVEILSRLPIKQVFKCKTVCKLWYHLLTSEVLSFNTNFPCMLLSDDYYSTTWLLELKADYDYYSLPDNRPIRLSSKFHLPRLKAPIHIIDSCNGFICLLTGSANNKNHSIYINNPLLGEYFKLKLPEWKKGTCRTDYKFCFSEASGKYKVLRLVFSIASMPKVSELEVYTLGVDEKWRNLGQVNLGPKPVWESFGNINVNGAIHWLGNSPGTTSIHSFNVGTEEVKSLPVPRDVGTDPLHWMLTELGNCLYLADTCYNGYVDIWWMKEYGIAQSWTKDRILTDSIPFNIHYSNLRPIIIWKDGEILMQRCCGTELASYNPEEKKFRKVNVYGSGNAATRYIPSFYSLKTVMGKTFQVSNLYPKTKIV